MEFEKTYPRVDVWFFRGIERKAADRSRTPWGITYKAFLRRESDVDGLTVVPEAHICFEMRIDAITKIKVAKVNLLANPENGQPLTVLQDEPRHGVIQNVPGFGSDRQAREDVAGLLAGECELLLPDEYEAAKQIRALEATEQELPT